MKRTIVIVILGLFLLSGCGRLSQHGTQSIIDWVDFVKVNGTKYGGLFEAVVADPALVTEKVVGIVEFNVNDNVHESGYRIKDGDAAFLPEGTKLYEIEGLDPVNFIAVKDEGMIHGYKIYYNSPEGQGQTWHFGDMKQDLVHTIEVYEGYPGHKKITTHEGDTVREILKLLDSSLSDASYSPSTKEGDPTAFRLVFYDGNPLVHMHHVFRDDAHYYFHPWYTNLIDDAIADYLK